MNFNEIIRCLTGVWRIVVRDPDASKYFNLSTEGFNRSFLALLLTLPVLFFSTTSLWRMAQSMEDSGQINFIAFAIVQLGGSILYWIIYLVSMIYIARFLHLQSSLSAYVVTFNWGTLFISALFAVPLLFYSLGLFDETGTSILFVPVLTGLAWYRWQIARQVLGAPAGAAVAILVFDFVLGAVIDQALARLI